MPGCRVSALPSPLALVSDVDHAVGQAGLDEQLGQVDGGAGGQLARLDDGGAADGQRERELLADDEQREVPRA